MDKLDYKKAYKDLYKPKSAPALITVPEMAFIMIDGKGNPNQEEGEYRKAVELLYALSYTIKMSKTKPDGYFNYVIPPLEGLWWLENDLMPDFINKDQFYWTSMIRQPEFVTEDVFTRACQEAQKKKPHLDINKARLQSFREGLCVQIMHTGPYDTEPQTIALLEDFIKNNHYQNAISDTLSDGTIRRHHEIYLSDPRKTAPEKMNTVIRHPVKPL